MSRVAGRYAKSLIDLAIEQGKLQSVIGDVEVLNESVKNRDLFLMLKSPIINGDKKESIMKLLFGERFESITMGFINICIAKSREGLLPEIVSEILAEYKRMQGITSVKVITATPLSMEALEALREKLVASNATAKSVEIETAVKPDLIGGFVIEFGDKLYDSSVAAKLAAFKKEFSGNLYESKIEQHGTA
ncbi:MAG: ATP synthase F1 subunit delta [Saprospiraceae bacterium]|nr:ATP synthase F1 subunit delta [Saprospiraceae bacterium]